MLLCRKYREKKDSDPDVDEETTNSSTNAFSQIYTNFNYNLMIIKEINRCKSKEEINEEESKMRKYLKEKTKEYYKSKRDLYTLKNLSYHKSKILGIISFSIYLTLFIVIVVLQLNISEAYSSCIVVQRITGEDVILGDTYFNFNDAPTFRNLNYSKEQTLIQNNYKNSKTHVSLNHLGLMDNTSFQKNVYSQNTIKSSLDHQTQLQRKINKQLKQNNTTKRSLVDGLRKLRVSFFDITQVNIIMDWLDQNLLQNLYKDDRTIRRQNYIIGDPQIYFGFRMVNKTTNSDEFTKNIIPFRIGNKEYTIFDSVEDKSFTYPIKLSTGETIDYIPEGNFSTFYGSGGYMLTYPRSIEGAFKLNYLNELGVTTSNWINYYYAFLSINRNNNNIILNVIMFDNLPSGEIIPNYKNYTIRRYYSSKKDTFRAVLEVIFLIMSCWYLYSIFKDLLFFIFSEFKSVLDRQSNSMKQNNICFRIIEINVKSHKDDSGLLIKIILKTVWFIIKGTLRLILSTLKFALTDLQNLLNITLTTITLMIISKWIYISTEDIFEVSEDGIAPGSIEYAFYLQKLLEDYKNLCACFILLSFTNFVKYITLSPHMSLFFETLKSATFDLLFFIATFIFIILGYALIGNSLFGLQDSGFSYVSDSLMTIVEIICGAVPIDSITSYSLILKYSYGISLTITILFLLDIMVAIIVSHYIEHLVQQGRIKSKIISHLIDKFTIIDYEKQKAEDSGLFTQTKHCVVNTLKRLVKAIRQLYLPRIELEYEFQVKKFDTTRCRKDILLNIKDSILHILEDSIDEDDTYMFRDVNQNKTKLSFWVSLIDHLLSAKISRNYLFTLCNQKYNLFEINFKLFTNNEFNEEEYYDDTITTFLIASFDEKTAIWSNASVKNKIKFWRALERSIEHQEPNFSISKSSETSKTNLNFNESSEYEIESIEELKNEYCNENIFQQNNRDLSLGNKSNISHKSNTNNRK